VGGIGGVHGGREGRGGCWCEREFCGERKVGQCRSREEATKKRKRMGSVREEEGERLQGGRKIKYKEIK
jgi:hypothetical protein